MTTHGRRPTALALTLAGALLLVPGPREARACGGLFCNGGGPNVTVPPAQSAERIVFVLNPQGWILPPEGLVAGGPVADGGPGDATGDATDDDGGPPPDSLTGDADGGADAGGPDAEPEPPAPPLVGPSVDAYIEIGYSGAAPDFAWIVPLLAPPTFIGTAAKDLFELDAATAPRFTFTYSLPQQSFSGGGGGSGCDVGCGAYGEAASSGADGGALAPTIPEVTVVSRQSVGPYDVAVLTSESTSALTDWLQANKYRIPDFAGPILARYVQEGKYFAAFKLQDGVGVGAIEPVVLRVPGIEPCIPLRMTPVASEPILSVTALVFGAGRARPLADSGFSEATVDMLSVRPTSPTTTSYPRLLREAIQGMKGRGFVTELAVPALDLGLPFTANNALAQIAARSRFLTRLSSRIAPEEMTADPGFIVEAADQEPVSNLLTIDITGEDDNIEALTGFNPGGNALGVAVGSGQNCAVAPAGARAAGGDASLAAGLSVALFALLQARRRAALCRR